MARERKPRKFQRNVAPKQCYFCVEKKDPTFEDIGTLRKFLTERGKIIPRSRSGVCARHQRGLSAAVKHARHLAFLPFVIRS